MTELHPEVRDVDDSLANSNTEAEAEAAYRRYLDTLCLCGHAIRAHAYPDAHGLPRGDCGLCACRRGAPQFVDTLPEIADALKGSLLAIAKADGRNSSFLAQFGVSSAAFFAAAMTLHRGEPLSGLDPAALKLLRSDAFCPPEWRKRIDEEGLAL